IFPLYYLVLFFFLFLYPLITADYMEIEEYKQHSWWFIFYLQNWFFIAHLPVHSQYLNHFWSLAVEEQYYLFWPFVILFFKSPRRLISFLLCGLLILFLIRSYLWYRHYANLNYTTLYLFTRFDGIFIGSLVALITIESKNFLEKNRAIIVIILALLNFLFYFLNSSGKLPYMGFVGFTTFASLFGILVYELCFGDVGLLKKIFSFSPLIFLGKISYGLYIFHWPIYYFLQNRINLFAEHQFGWHTLYINIFTGIVTTVFAVLISVISYYFFEMRFLKLKARFE
ncbi:MAG: acyltransferase, partial [Bacteroidetes bacterium]|nr:acyltransferase [Bacteroidota bacterium]